MEKYRKKQEILVYKWTGDISIIDEINTMLKTTEYDGLKVELSNKDILCISYESYPFTTKDFASIGEYIVFDTDDIRPLSTYNEERFNENFVEII
jgi:peroxiredoxin